jgi:microcompartment protein CcmL/EutN
VATQTDLPHPLPSEPALALLEYSSIAAGIESADAMVKRAETAVIRAGTVQPGRFLVLLGGEIAEVDEALKTGLTTASDALNAHVYLPGVDPAVLAALSGQRDAEGLNDPYTALGVYETANVPAAIKAADVGVKGAEVTLAELRLAEGLGGKGFVLFTGKESDVAAAIELIDAEIPPAQKVRHALITQLHNDIGRVLALQTRFGAQLNWQF